MDVTKKKLEILDAIADAPEYTHIRDIMRTMGEGLSPLSTHLTHLVRMGALRRGEKGYYRKIQGVQYTLVKSDRVAAKEKARKTRAKREVTKREAQTASPWNVDCALTPDQQREAARMYVRQVPRTQIAKKLGVKKPDLIDFLLQSNLGS